jgi:hypothetical protein
MRLAVYNPDNFKSADEALANSALYPMSSELTYDNYASVMDASETIEICAKCLGVSLQMVINQGKGWVEPVL